MQFVHAHLETRHFRFDAYGADFASAEEAMMDTIISHCSAYRASADNFLAEYQEHIVYSTLETGCGYRDGEKLIPKAAPVSALRQAVTGAIARGEAEPIVEQPAKPTAFEVGKTYSTRSACDHDCIYSFQIVRRTAKQITFLYHGKEETRGVRMYEGVERCSPFGRYSMSPSISADRPGEIY